jgi:hypothetical protein
MPTIRTWPGQKCVPCEEHDLPCGPNIHSRQSTTTKLGNTSSLARNRVTGCVESQAAKTTNNNSTWEGMNDLDCTLSLTDSEADRGHSVESFDAFSLDCLLNMPFDEPQHRKETRPGRMVGHSDEPSRESLPALPGLGNLAPSDDLLEIDQRFVTYDPRSDSLTDQN